MPLQAHTLPTLLVPYAKALGHAPLARFFSDTACGRVSTRALSIVCYLNTANTAVAGAVSLVNSNRSMVSRIACSISTSINAPISTLIEVERRGAERIAQVQTVTKSIRDLTTDCTQARTPRTARPAFTRRPLSTMTSTTNTPLRRASGDSRSLN